MQARLLYTIALVGLLPVAQPALADGEDQPQARSHTSLRPVPLKDCTRYNGRVGYYGNPWCSEKEQQQWDLWVDRRRLARGQN